MYFPVGWPKAINLAMPDDNATIVHICSDAVKILVAAMGHDFLGIWYANPIIPITFYKRNAQSLETFGRNKLIIWKPDSRELAVLTENGALLLYQIDFEANGSSILTQVDSPSANLKRDSAELFIRENIPRLSLHEVCGITLNATITTVCCISLSELLIATDRCELIRTQWSELRALTAEGTAKYKSDDPDNGNGGAPAGSAFVVINLRNIPFYVHQNSNLKTLPPIGPNSFIAALEYSPFIGGCAAVFNDRRAAFLIAAHLRFETQSIHGLWVSELDDATVCSVNHKFRLMAYGRTNGDINVYAIEDTTGGLEFSHRLSVNDSVLPGSLGSVNELKWSPDGCVLVVAWHNGGISLWSTFGALLMSSLSWDFGLNVDLLNFNPLQVHRLEWSTEGYQLFMTCQREAAPNGERPDIGSTNVLQISFVKSTLAMNPCMAQHSHVLLQGDDTLYLNQGNNLEKIYFGSKSVFPNNQNVEGQDLNAAMTSPVTPEDESMEVKSSVDISSILSESKYWTVLQLPQTYASTNWPIRYSAIDEQGQHLAVAGRTGLAHYSMLTKKWKLFGNETQEKDFVVSGGLIWWKGFIIMGCYSLLDRIDEIRCYPEECKLDNEYGNKFQVRAPAISLNIFRDQLIVLTSDGIVSLFVLKRLDAYSLSVECSYEVDVKSICIHPACIVSLTVTNLRNDIAMKNNAVSAAPVNDAAETIIANVCGRILMIQRDSRNAVINSLMASCLASCVEIFWLSNSAEKSPMRDCLWLYSGAHGMRVWLPILPPLNQQVRDIPQRLHTFMAKRIMLSFPLKLYPLAILFDNVVVLGVENETTLYMNGSESHFALPFCLLERKSQVYIHKILRQLIKRNLGYSAWEIAKSCRSLPYFSHSLELLLHEVLEEEATSKEPIPDALLPSILDFIREFPVYLQTIVQCARKTEIALWPYLFSVAGKPKDLFQQCLQSEELETAASYLIILQNLEPSIVSKQYATLLLDISLQNCKWELAKDLVRFLKAIDPNEIDSPRSSMTVNIKIAPPSQTQSQVNQNPEVFNLILGPIARERSFSTTVVNTIAAKEKKESKSTNMMASSTAGTVASAGNESSLSIAASNSAGQVVRRKSERSNSTKERKETFCIESILQRHARKLLQQCKIFHLGYMCAFLDFHLVSWLSQEADRTAKLDDYVLVLTTLHAELNLPAPVDPNTSSEEHSLPNCSPMEFHHAQFQRQFSWDQRFNKQHRPSSQTSESGYFSLAQMDTPTSTSTNNGNGNQPQIASIKEHEEAPGSNHLPEAMQRPDKATRSNSQISLDTARLRRMYSLHDDMMAAAGESVTPPGLMQYPMGLEYVNQGETRPLPRYLSDKISIKIRYLLQLFIEANCTDYALVLSILLQDAASIGRIINVVIRSEALAACQRIDGALKRLTQWSFDRPCLYRSFMIHIQPHIYMLEQYLLKSSASANNNTSGGGGSGKADDSGKLMMLGDVSAVDGVGGVGGALSNSLSSLSFKDSAKTKNPPIGQLGNVWDTFSNESSDMARDSGELAHDSIMPNGKRSSKELIARNETGSCGIM